MAKAETELLISSPVGAEVLMYGRVRKDCHPADTVQAKLVSKFIAKQGALLGKDENQPDSSRCCCCPEARWRALCAVSEESPGLVASRLNWSPMPDGHIPLTESQAEAPFPELIVIDVWVWDVYFPCNVNFHKATFIESSVIWDIREMTNNQEMVELLSPKGVGMAQTHLQVPLLSSLPGCWRESYSILTSVSPSLNRRNSARLPLRPREIKHLRKRWEEEWRKHLAFFSVTGSDHPYPK